MRTRDGVVVVKLSALICVHNQEAQLSQCLRRLSFCDEVVVVADRCTDRSQEIARRHGAVIVSGIFPLENQRRSAGLAAASGQWVLEVDAGRADRFRLAWEIRATLDARRAGDWYEIPVDNYVGDELVRHGWGGSFGTDRAARLYRPRRQALEGASGWTGRQCWTAPGGRAEGRDPHNLDEDIGDMIHRLTRYTALRGEDLADSGKIKSLPDDAFRGVRRFFKCYVSRKGYTEGDLGFLISLMAGLYPMLSNLKAREIRMLNGQNVQAMRPGAVIGLDLEDARLGHLG
jgi:glycosyltransferase involved in cell wall biosynthesis